MSTSNLRIGVLGAGGHGGSDTRIVAESLDYLRGKTEPSTSPVAARYSVAVGCAATESLRNGGIPIDIPPLGEALRARFPGPTPNRTTPEE